MLAVACMVEAMTGADLFFAAVGVIVIASLMMMACGQIRGGGRR